MSDNKSVQDLRFEILSRLSGNGCDFVDLLNQFPVVSLTQSVIKELIKAGLVEGKCEAFSHLRLSSAGQIRLAELQEEFEKEADQQAKQKTQRRADRIMQILQIIAPLAAAVLAWLLTKMFP